MQMKKKRSLLLALAVIALMLSITACVTKIEYVREIPAVDFPIFPPPDCVTYDEATDTVSMPLEYWQRIAEYKIDVDAARDYLDYLRAHEKHKGEKVK